MSINHNFVKTDEKGELVRYRTEVRLTLLLASFPFLSFFFSSFFFFFFFFLLLPSFLQCQSSCRGTYSNTAGVRSHVGNRSNFADSSVKLHGCSDSDKPEGLADAVVVLN